MRHTNSTKWYTAWSQAGTNRASSACALVGVVLAVFMAGGCELVGVLAYSMFPEKIQAEYTLTNRPTLVLVDDPANLLRDHNLPLHAANHIGSRLTERAVLTLVVPPKGVYQLAADLGKDYARTPVDTIGAKLGAQQVIHVFITSVDFGATPGLYTPSLSARVKVIEVDTHTRIFPPPVTVDTPPGYQGYRSIQFAMRSRVAGDNPSEDLKRLQRRLAERLASDVAHLFYKYQPDHPDEEFKD